MKRRIVTGALLFTIIALPQVAEGQAIRSAVGATVNSGGPGLGNIANTFNQVGLLTGYTSGVTNFDDYLASNPKHRYLFDPNEWFSNEFTTSSTVTYDLGAIYGISALALWNEDGSGIGFLNLLGSTTGADGSFVTLVSGLAPTPNTPLFDYGAQKIAFASTSARYVRLEMSRCPVNGNAYQACAIGEVAFREATVVPEPSTMLLTGLSLAGLAEMLRRRRRTN